ncbi:hypothetical protein GCM10011581_43270 [Saccharopolyspora subtropica]|uniref:Condensation domain-containing protein n=1 Tax=Saccharopolyspora thermophila TaxID=89367 RepID=A0A917K8D1_9PSEU|nr:hypothetical protein GCM10011581_43270 [Saccharopolyspora subtropica]
MTAAQTWVWLAQQAQPQNPAHKAAEYLDVRGPVDVALVEAAVRRAVAEAEAFRIRIGADERGPWQVVDPAAAWPLPVVDLRDAADPWQQAQAWMAADLEQPLDPASELPFRMTLLRLAADRCLLHVACHHIAMDGYGFSLFAQRIAEHYTAWESEWDRGANPFGSLRALVADEIGYLGSDRFQRDREYWLRELAELPEIRSLSGAPHRAAPCRNFLRETETVPVAVVDRLREQARRSRVSLPTLAMAALGVHTHLVTGSEDLLLELTVTGRQGAIARTTPGMLSNTLPLRLRVRPEMSVAELLRHTAERARGLLQHQRYPLLYLPQDLGIPDMSEIPQPPAINIMGYDPPLRFGQHPVTLHNLSNGSVEDFALNVYQRCAEGSLRIDSNASPALYRPEDVIAHHRGFLDVFHALADVDPEQPVGKLAPQIV